MNMLDLYEEMKEAIHYFDLNFYEMKGITVRLDVDRIKFKYGTKEIIISDFKED